MSDEHEGSQLTVCSYPSDRISTWRLEQCNKSRKVTDSFKCYLRLDGKQVRPVSLVLDGSE